ncbi:MAG: helicase C-terminal domain-containing protein [Coriobacteriales bacterium]
MPALAPDISRYIIDGTDDEAVASYATLAERARTAQFGLVESEYVVLDTETTGLKVDEEELIEIAAAIVCGPEVVDTFQTFVYPGKRIPDIIVDLTSITDEDVAGAPEPADAVARLEAFVGDRMLIAHNARFDRSFIERYASARSPLARRTCWIDTLSLSRIALPRLISHDQTTMCDAFGVPRGNHRAIGDVEALAKLWRIMLVALGDLPHDALAFMAQLAPGFEWPLRHLVKQAAADMVDVRFSMQSLRDRAIARHANPGGTLIDPGSSVLDLAPVTREQVEEAFSPGGIVGRMYERFEARPEQIDFALDVAEAFHSSTHRVIEAGTGVGKSVSYLLPAALFAKRNRARVGVATKTNNLLDQLMFRELPLLRDALLAETGSELTYIALKGYDHYPCLRKLMRFAREMDAESSEYDVVTVCAVIASVAQSTWGDLDSLSASLSALARANIVCSSEECLHGKCSFFPKRCLLHGARRKANESEIIVTNHALLFRDMSMEQGIMPPIRYWIVDEAHGMEEEARDQFSLDVRASDTMALLRKLGGSQGVLTQMQHQAIVTEGGSALMGSLSSAIETIPPTEQLCDALFDTVRGLARFGSGRAYSVSDVWINDELRDTEQWEVVRVAGTSLLEHVDKLVRACRNILSLAEQYEEFAEFNAELSSATMRLGELIEGLSLVLDGSNADYYYYATIHNERGERSRRSDALHAALVDMGGVLSERFFPETNSAVLTSATVAVGKSFDYFVHRVGLDRLEEGMWATRHLEPSEGFYDNMRMLVVKDLPEPRSAGYDDALVDLVREVHLGLRGGILTLFTNKREMLAVYEALRPIMKAEGIELLCQGVGKSKRVLTDEFTAKEDSCLFALRTFWEGFDAPGRTLRCVLLPKLPFSRPDDPLYQERNARQNDAWKAFVLPQAIIDTRQAAGRLIRSRNDAGFLILGDRRLQTKWYGKVFLKSFASETRQMVGIADIADVLSASRDMM